MFYQKRDTIFVYKTIGFKCISNNNNNFTKRKLQTDK
jgi:hypothetical protein